MSQRTASQEQPRMRPATIKELETMARRETLNRQGLLTLFGPKATAEAIDATKPTRWSN